MAQSRQASPAPRTVILPQMGQQPDLRLPQPSPPEPTPNPMLASLEPVTIEKPIKMPDRQEVRRVVEAEIDELMEWGLPRFQVRFPRCTAESVRPMLVMACRGGKLCFLRTDNACALFCAEVTPWEPVLSAFEIFVVAKSSIYAGKEVLRLYRAGLKWAVEINACAYQYGSSTGHNIQAFADRVGYDIANQSFTKYLTAGMVIPDPLDEAAE